MAKEKVERGQLRRTKKKIVQAKIFTAQTHCKCEKGCPDQIDITRQRDLFDAYYGKSNHSQKVMLIRSSAITQPVQRKNKALYLPLPKSRTKELSLKFRLTDDLGQQHMVCRDFFLNLYQIAPSTLRMFVKSAATNPSAQDLRGNAPCKKKTSDDDLDYIRAFIGSLPQYESHYGRSWSQKKYLKPGLNINKLYQQYELKCKEEKREHIVSDPIFRRVFNSEFNLGFKEPHTDTCKTCDALDSALQDPLLTPERRHELLQKQLKHHDGSKKVKEEFDEDVDKAKATNDTAVLTFDLQKALATPKISTNIAFYKRQLWTYNLCIFDEANGSGD